MATLTITDKKARELYPTASSDLKTILVETFGEQFFSGKITDRIKTWTDVHAELNGEVGELTGTKDEIAYKKLKAIAKVLNEGWVPDWDNSNQYKWYPWFYMTKTSSSPSGFGLGVVCDDYSCSYVGSRLCYRTRKLAEHAAKHFIDLYRDLMVQ